MGASLWNQLWLPLMIGVAIQIVVAALCLLSVQLWNCLVKLINTQTAVGESAHNQPLPDSDAAAHANSVPDLETGNGSGPAEGGEMTGPELELGIVKSGEGCIVFLMFARGLKPRRPRSRGTQQQALLCLSKLVDVPHSQHEEGYPDDPISLSHTETVLEGLSE